MFAAPSNQEQQNYNFFSKDNVLKWKGIFTGPLEKVLSQVHSSLKAKKDALSYVENLNLRLLELLCAKPQPHTIQDVEERVQRTFPNPIDKWAIRDAQSAIEKGKKKINLVLPVEKIHSLLQKDVLQYKVDFQVSVYIVAVLEYISADILKLVGNYVKNIKHVEISEQDIDVAMCADKVLMDMFHQDHHEETVVHEDEKSLEKATTYDKAVKEIINKEKPYLRELHLIIKVFRDQIANYLAQATPKDLDIIFSCVTDIAEFTSTLISSLEDSLEVKEDNQDLAVGSCFEELSEAAEFDYYDKYAKDVLKTDCRNKLQEFVQNPDINLALQSAGHGFRDAVKYVLPKLLLNPVYHAFQYFEYIKVLLLLSTSESDRESLEQVEGLLKPLQVELERILLNSGHILRRQPGEVSLYSQSRTGRQAALTALNKLNELQKSIDCWEGKEIGQLCNEFICEGVLGKVSQGKRLTERYVFLFDGVMILCKQNSRRTSVTGPTAEFKMKEKFFIRKVEIIDREDSEELRNAFEIAPRLQPKIILFAKSPEEKNDWMAALIMLNTRSMLERTLDSILLDEEKKHPLTLPPPEIYRFSEEDSSSNIVFEEKFNNLPLIKGATLTKLIERLTYHMYADPMLIRTFLTTYRSMCSPKELLGHLIDRFEIPELLISEDTDPNTAREMVKRFKRDYVQPVQFRVLNVIRHWVHHHFYDFERDAELLQQLQTFLDTVKDKSMKKWVISITKVMQRRRECIDEQREIIFAFDKSPPPIEWHVACCESEYDLMTLHPIEIARQLTVLEFDLYRAVKPSELVGSVWTKKNKEETSPNLLKMIHHTTNVTRWLQKCIVESKNIEERVAVVARIVEIMLVLQELNNFNGVLAIVSAMGSAAVHRLTFTLQAIPYRYQKSLDEALQLNNDHFRKYCEKLRSINPPCVPFFGMYLTNILHIEEGNPDFLPKFGKDIINFGKRRKVAEITAEIQQYQDLPYCLSIEHKIRRFLETLDPFPDKDENEICNYLYTQSLVIEPRGCRQPPKFPRRWPELSLKSPGIKPRHLPGRSHPNPLPSLGDRLFSSTQRLGGNSEDQEESLSQSTSPQGTTPTTPSTPVTPTHSNNDNCIFATVLIGQSPCPSIAGSTLSLAQSFTSNLPPPLPPRRKREPSEGGTSPRVKQAPDAPMLPPRDSTSPPPLPPRSASLPRAQSTTGLLGRVTSSFDIPPRRSSAIETPFRMQSCGHFNGVTAAISPHLIKQNTLNGGLSSPRSPDIVARQHLHDGVFVYPGDESGHKFRSVPASPHSNFSSTLTSQQRFKEPNSPSESSLAGVSSCRSGLGVGSLVFNQDQRCLTAGPELPPKSSRLQTLSSSGVCRTNDHVHGVKR